MILIDDPDDDRLAPFRLNERGLTNRPQRRDDGGDGLFMAEGDLVVQRALDAGCVPAMALVDALRPPALTQQLAGRCEVFAGGERLRAAVTKLGMPYTVVALFQRPLRIPAAELAANCRRLVIAEAVDNPVNIGSIVRNALAMGWDGLVVDATSADPLARRALRVSMGHALHLAHARTTDVPALVRSLVQQGVVVCALTPAADAVPLDTIAPADRMALLVGSERAGLTQQAMHAATHRVCIPMHTGVDSLNAAAASAVACWQLRP
ncbi:MAG: RNA methyltransferase [Actinomycetota bacterium]|nr:RNA methyltransferase [Actinomycetota bacterium]